MYISVYTLEVFSSFGSSFTSNPLAKTTAYVDSNIAKASMVSTVLTENEELVLITYSLRDILTMLARSPSQTDPYFASTPEYRS